MSAQPTPGPWRWTPSTEKMAAGIHPRDADSLLGMAFLDEDARLIAAAPELYEACKAFIAWWRESDHDLMTMPVEQMLDAIAKAEGREP